MQKLNKQRGSALIISLVILTAITLAAVIAMQRSTLQVRMVGNLQHQQTIFNAAYSNLGGLMEQLRQSGNTTDILNDAVTLYHQDPDADGINPFATNYALTAPQLPSNVKSVTNTVKSFEPPTGSSAISLKEMEGSSGATFVPYYFTSTATADDDAQAVSSTQQIGFYFLAPAPN